MVVMSREQAVWNETLAEEGAVEALAERQAGQKEQGVGLQEAVG